MIRVAHEGVKVLGRCGSFEDPTDSVCEHWPWLDGEPGERMLRRLANGGGGGGGQGEQGNNAVEKACFDPFEALLRLQSNRGGLIEEETC